MEIPNCYFTQPNPNRIRTRTEPELNWVRLWFDSGPVRVRFGQKSNLILFGRGTNSIFPQYINFDEYFKKLLFFKFFKNGKKSFSKVYLRCPQNGENAEVNYRHLYDFQNSFYFFENF